MYDTINELSDSKEKIYNDRKDNKYNGGIFLRNTFDE
jgi:hypothetical protein